MSVASTPGTIARPPASKWPVRIAWIMLATMALSAIPIWFAYQSYEMDRLRRETLRALGIGLHNFV